MSVTRQPPLFSIIIPTYNRPKQLRDCLQAISELDYPRHDFEIVVVDDGGQTDLAQVCQPFEAELDISLIRKPNGGPASARNVGVLESRGTHLAFTDDDCELHPGWLRGLKAEFERHPGCMIGGRTINRLQRNIYSRASQLIVDIVYRHYNAKMSDAQFIASNNMAMPREHFDEVGGFDLSFFLEASEDRELCARWLARGLRIVYNPELIVYHSHVLNLSRFCRQHFAYGRGAYCFRKLHGSGVRKELVESSSQGFAGEFGFHLNLKKWLLVPFLTKQAKPFRLMLLLLLWQTVNTCGYFWQAMQPARGVERH